MCYLHFRPNSQYSFNGGDDDLNNDKLTEPYSFVRQAKPKEQGHKPRGLGFHENSCRASLPLCLFVPWLDFSEQRSF